MKVVKNILVGIIAIGVMVALINGLNANTKKAMEMCTNAGHSVQYCEAHIG